VTAEPQAKQGFALTRTALCTRIDALGKFAPASDPRRAGKNVLVYLEAIGVTYRPTADGGMESRLEGTLSIEPATGGPSTVHVVGPVVDRDPSRRDGYFCHVKLRLPATLTPGDYRLIVKLRDTHGGETAQGALTFRVAAETGG
jgi:hypothetical protein